MSKDKDLAKVLADLKRGADITVSRLGDMEFEAIERFSTGSLLLDKALGGGLPKGRIVEIWGYEASGKTMLTLHAISEVQKTGGTCAFVDAEHAFNPEFAENLGVDTGALLFTQPDSGEQGLEAVEKLLPHADLIVVDSVANLVPKAILEGDFEKASMGVHARMMSTALKKLTGAASRHGCTIIFINQVREKIGVMFGNPDTTTGGNSLKFYASVRLEMTRTSFNKVGDQVVGHRARVRVRKNKTAAPHKQAEFDIYYGHDGVTGIDKYGEVLDVCLDAGIIEKSGAWFTIGGQRAQGRTAARDLIANDPELYESLRKDAVEMLSP